MRFEDLNWMEMESYLHHDDRVILVTGACEQHAFLSLLTDIKIPLAIADAVSKKKGVVVAPPLNFGCSLPRSCPSRVRSVCNLPRSCR